MILETIEYKISGPLREPLILLEWSIFLLFLELSLIFLLRYLHKENKLRNLQDLAYFFFFLGFAVSKLLYMMGDFYVPIQTRMNHYTAAYLMQISGFSSFVYFLEKYKVFIKKFLFTKVFIVIISIFISIVIFVPAYTQTFTYMFFLPLLLFIMIYLRIILKEFYKKKELGRGYYKFIIFCLGIFFVTVGFGFATDFAANLFGLQIRLLGDSFEIIGFIFLFMFFISIPSFSEHDWKNKIKSIYITNKSGLFIFKKDFQDLQEPIDKNIAAGLLTSIEMFLNKLTNQQGLSIIEKTGRKIIIYPSKYVNGIIICDEELISIKILLKNFIDRIEQTFQNILKNWKGDLKVFDPISNLVEEIFS